MRSNSAYRCYKSQVSLSWSYNVLTASETSVFVTAAKGVEFLVNIVTIQGLKILRNEAGQEVLPPIKRAKHGRPKVARIRPTYHSRR
jgi:hypothetical protein